VIAVDPASISVGRVVCDCVVFQRWARGVPACDSSPALAGNVLSDCVALDLRRAPVVAVDSAAVLFSRVPGDGVVNDLPITSVPELYTPSPGAGCILGDSVVRDRRLAVEVPIDATTTAKVGVIPRDRVASDGWRGSVPAGDAAADIRRIPCDHIALYDGRRTAAEYPTTVSIPIREVRIPISDRESMQHPGRVLATMEIEPSVRISRTPFTIDNGHTGPLFRHDCYGPSPKSMSRFPSPV